MPIKYNEKVLKHLKELEDLNIIRRSKSKWNSPAFPILKKNGNIRLVVDYKELNKITKSLFCPIPKISEEFIELNKSTIFSQIDLRMGYHQIEIDDSNVEKTAFTILNRKYEFLRMPFGLKNAPFHFQEAIFNLLIEYGL